MKNNIPSAFKFAFFLAAILILNFHSSSIKAQTLTIVGNGTSTNSASTYPAPFGNAFEGARHQFYVSAVEMFNAGIAPNASISSIGFNVTSLNGSAPLQDFQVKVYLTGSFNPLVSAWQTTGLAAQSAVFTHTPVLGWNQINLVTPFVWNGSTNVVIETCFLNSTSSLNVSTQLDHTLSSTTFSRWYRANNAPGVCTTPLHTANSTTLRPNFRFGWTSGCTTGSFYDTYTPTCTGSPETYSTCTYAGEYNTLSLTGNIQYTLGSSNTSDFITVSNSTGTVIFASGTQPINFTPSTTGSYRVYIHTNSSCGTQNSCRNPSVQCTIPVGCTNGVFYTTFTPTCTGSNENYATCTYAGEYNDLSLTNGTAYTFGSSITTDYITITNATGTSVLAHGTQPLNYSPTATATYRVYIHTNSSCGTQSACRNPWVQCAATPTGCTNGVAYLSVTPTCNGTQQDYTTCTYAGEYNTLSLTNNTAYTFGTSVATDFITITNATGTSVLTSGTAPLSFTPSTTASFRVYIHTNSSCGTQSTCRSTWVQCAPTPTGCTNGVAYLTATPNCTGTQQNYSTCTHAGEYNTLSLTINVAYTFGSSVTTDYITITNAAGTTVLTAGTTPVSFTPSSTSSYRVYIHTNSSCGTQSTCRSTWVQCGGSTAPANDLVCNATSISCGQTINGTTINATSTGTYEGTSTCGTQQASPAVWYSVAGNGLTMRASLCNTSSWDSKISIYSGTCTNLTCIGGIDDNGPACSGTPASFEWSSAVGTNYYIKVYGYSTTSNFSLELECGPSSPTSITSPTTVCVGDTFQVTANGASGTTYWFVGGCDTSGQITSGATTGLVANQAGTFTLYARNFANNMWSSSCASITITISNAPVLSNITPATICGSGSATLSASTSAGTIQWYSAATGGVLLGTGSNFTTPNISSSTTYYVVATLGSCNSGARVPVTASVQPVPTVIGTAVGGNRCGSGTVNISISGLMPGTTVDWFANASGGSVLSGGLGTSNFTTPNISSNTTYYAQIRDTSSGCVNSSRIAVTATVNPLPATSTAVHANRCGNGSLTLSVSNVPVGSTVDWYANSSGGSALISGNSTYTTGNLSSTTTFYAETRNLTSGCVSASRTAVIATINPIPTVSTTTPASRCGSGTLTLGATASSGNLNWYTTATGGSAIGTGTSFTTPSISSSTTYYVEAVSNGCVSANRVAVTATVNAIPASVNPIDGDRCGSGTVILSVNNIPGGSTVDWYGTLSGGTVLSGGSGTSIFTTPVISSTTNYYAETRNSSTGCISASRTLVVAEVFSTPSLLSSFTSITCNGDSTGTASVIAGGSASPYSFLWSNGATTNQLNGLSAGTYYITVTDNNNCSTIDTVIITEPSAIQISLQQNSSILCFGDESASIQSSVTGGVPPYTHNWSNQQSGTQISNLASGTYTVTVTDGNACNKTESIQINQPDSLQLNVSTTSTTCENTNNGEINISASGGTPAYSYIWNTGDNTTNLSNLATGMYSVTLSDLNQCQLVDSIEITYLYEAPVIAIDDSVKLCVGYPITLNAGNQGAIFTWSTGATTQSIEVNTAGQYSITVENAEGCISSKNIEVYEDPCVGIEKPITKTLFSVYPNPNEGRFIIESDEEAELVLVNSVGQHIGIIRVNTGLNEINEFDKLATGVYYLVNKNALNNPSHIKLVIRK